MAPSLVANVLPHEHLPALFSVVFSGHSPKLGKSISTRVFFSREIIAPDNATVYLINRLEVFEDLKKPNTKGGTDGVVQ